MRMFGAVPGFTEPATMTREEATGWYERVTSDPNPLHWAVELDGRFIGTARLHSLDKTDERARYAVGILDRTVLGRGLGQQITRLVLAYGFTVVGLHRTDLRVLAFNVRAINCYGQCGFVEEGREREAALIDGTWHDDVIMGILDYEFARTQAD